MATRYLLRSQPGTPKVSAVKVAVLIFARLGLSS